MRILVSRLSALGDVVCSLPVAISLKSLWPDCNLTWLIDRRFRSIVECCTGVDQVIERPKKLQAVRDLGQFDVAIDLQGLLKSGLLVGFSRARQKLGYHWQREGSWLFSQRVLPDATSNHIVDQYVDVARAIGASTDRAEFGLFPKPEDVDSVRIKLFEGGWDGSPFILANPGAGWLTKRWSPSKYVEFTQRSSLPCVIMGAKSERDALAEVVKGEVRNIDMVGKTSIGELVALVSLCSVCVGGDTGSTHLGAALAKPTVGIYTLTRLERSCPYGQIDNCFQGDPSVNDVLRKVESLMP